MRARHARQIRHGITVARLFVARIQGTVPLSSGLSSLTIPVTLNELEYKAYIRTFTKLVDAHVQAVDALEKRLNEYPREGIPWDREGSVGE